MKPATGRQRTIARSCTLEGIGIHSGKLSHLIISPSPEDSGIFFIKEGEKIPALAEEVIDTRRGTSLRGIAVVEHLLSAVIGLEIDNLAIEIKGDEIPTLDGSALPFAQALRAAGIIDQAKGKSLRSVRTAIKVGSGESTLSAQPFDGLKMNFMVEFPVIGVQNKTFILGADDYFKEIAPARTFGYLEEYESLKQAGRAQGAGLENALVLDQNGYVNPPRFPDEVVRHKILDLIGDLALVGFPFKGEITAVKSGHRLNLELAQALRRQLLK